MTLTIKCFVSGRVQGVFFRASTRDVAARLGISGHAINLADGRVEVVAHGTEQQLNDLKAFLKTGPLHAKVESLTCETIEDQPCSSGFMIG